MFATPPTVPASHVVELRQYTLHPGKRDALIELFERRFIETQEAVGIQVLGQFRDLDDPNRFVWLRGFPDMPSRARSLAAFYDGPVWKAHRDEANATMVDSDDVLLLEPVDAGSPLSFEGERPPLGGGRRQASLVVATVYLLTPSAEADFPRFFEASLQPLLVETGARPLARFATEHAANDFPRLPVRDERAFVWLASFPSDAAYDAHLAALAASKGWTAAIGLELERRLKSPAQRLRLAPTERSFLGNVEPASPATALPGYTTERIGDVHDFDFLEGEWEISSRRLATRGAGANDWEEFPGTSVCRLHLGGMVNADENVFPTKGFSGMTVRSFDVRKKQWSIYWISSRTGTLFPPVVGGFGGAGSADSRGEFYGEDEDGGRPVKVRFLWSPHGKDAARWEQAFSFDGSTWETNWVMELRRRRAE